MTAMYESALLQGNPAQNAAEFNTYAFIMLLVGTRQKEGPTAFFQVGATNDCFASIFPLPQLLSAAIVCSICGSPLYCRQHIAHRQSETIW